MNHLRNYFTFLTTSVLFVASFSSDAKEPDFTLNIGGYFSQGNYGLDQDTFREDTRISSLPVSLKIRQWPWALKISSSWSKVESSVPVTLKPGIETGSTTKTDSGIGDTLFTLSYSWLKVPINPWYTSVWFKLKAPTADESKDLGSGEFDFEPGLTLMRLGAWNPFLKLSYRLRGDSDSTNYNNQWKTTAGISHKLNDEWQLTGFLSSKQASTKPGKTSTSVYTTLLYRINRHWSVTPYASAGLSDGSHDYAVGWNLTYRF